MLKLSAIENKKLADELGIEVERIYKWCSAAKSATLSKLEKPVPDVTLEIKRAWKALKEKELELEILKKTVHIFSKSDGESMNLYSVEKMCSVFKV